MIFNERIILFVVGFVTSQLNVRVTLPKDYLPFLLRIIKKINNVKTFHIYADCIETRLSAPNEMPLLLIKFIQNLKVYPSSLKYYNK